MSARIIAVYSSKGGVGKTTLSVNLAWAAATLSARRTLLWDLDAQAAASWVLGGETREPALEATLKRDGDARQRIVPTAIDRLDLLPADASLRGLDHAFHDLDKKRRLAKVATTLGKHYDRIVIDCPPGLTDTADQVMRAADLVVVPVIPSPLARRALDAIIEHVASRKGPRVTLAPVFSMVDRRRSIHREALETHADWPVIPMASVFEAMTERRAPLGAFAPRASLGVEAVANLWRRLEAVLVQ